MMAQRASHALLAGAVLLLAGCATNTHPLFMQMPATGQTLSGAFSTAGGSQDVALTSDDGRLACNGVSLRAEATQDCRTSGSLRLQCTDGRDVSGGWKMEDCASGLGSGADSLGNAVAFFIGAYDADTMMTLAAVTPVPVPVPQPKRRSATEPRERPHLFRFGGDYATGFGDPSHFAYETVFKDAESGLVIVQLGASQDAPMSLSEVSLQAGEEAFVVMPETSGSTGVERIRVEAAGSGLKMGGGISLPAGLPVTNLDGQVVALTNGNALVAAKSVRRYLQLVAPALSRQPATQATPEQLRERITVRQAD